MRVNVVCICSFEVQHFPPPTSKFEAVRSSRTKAADERAFLLISTFRNTQTQRSHTHLFLLLPHLHRSWRRGPKAFSSQLSRCCCYCCWPTSPMQCRPSLRLDTTTTTARAPQGHTQQNELAENLRSSGGRWRLCCSSSPRGACRWASLPGA